MTLAGKTIAITGAARGLGAALALVAADRAMVPILLGRSRQRLDGIAQQIAARTGVMPVVIELDLANTESVARAAADIAAMAPNLDILVNSGSQWSGGDFESQSDEKILAVINSTLSGTVMLTRRLLPLLKSRPNADIHTVVSMSGLPYARMVGSAVPFVAAKAGQNGFVQALTEELKATSIRVTSIHPGIIEDIQPADQNWDADRGASDMLTNRNVAEAIMFILSQPPNVAIRSLVIERALSDFLA